MIDIKIQREIVDLVINTQPPVIKDYSVEENDVIQDIKTNIVANLEKYFNEQKNES